MTKEEKLKELLDKARTAVLNIPPAYMSDYKRLKDEADKSCVEYMKAALGGQSKSITFLMFPGCVVVCENSETKDGMFWSCPREGDMPEYARIMYGTGKIEWGLYAPILSASHRAQIKSFAEIQRG